MKKILKIIVINTILIFVISMAFSLEINNKSLQRKCQFLKETYGELAVVITNPQNGNINFIYNKNMLFNRRYCPGSLLKPFTILTISQNNKINTEEKHTCPGYQDPEDIGCWLGVGHNELNLYGAISKSCNYYFYKFVENKLQKKDYFELMSRLNLVKNINYDKITNKEFYKAAIGLDVLIQTKPIDVIFAYNCLFNDGKLFDSTQNFVTNIDFNDYVLEIIRMGMHEGYLYGTSKTIYEKTKLPDLIVKTGTGAGTKYGLYDWTKNVGWVMILSPSQNPTFSMLVIVEKSKSSTACEVAGEIINFLLKKYNTN
ncbi:MAG: hypothetical protein A2086_07830 [Spirochaetes bacterium GWD1_27_9]|nr:MAG: hypothetical protein A2Z98_12340 [Spirochaetes bacterium GWB1_27_13]OHD45995.1 MAG: hypothetical protein A2086_07830 [Spirochaetes bacterium GWD1_27_9]